MTLFQYGHAGVVLLLLAAGQLLFERAADSAQRLASLRAVLGLLTHAPFVAGMVCYACATLLYIALLQHVPLSHAYPLMAINYVLVPVLALIRSKTVIPPRLIIGLVVLAIGLLTIATD